MKIVNRAIDDGRALGWGGIQKPPSDFSEGGLNF